ncbi:hypothetical protein GCM10019016_103050 [Streptomyces prasinosporus]|uniref:Uncharacterized protein n=1 Tax=Streptomyces prasinosporus TaxID=68256 RepID=A0ABP6TXH0_9ACTN
MFPPLPPERPPADDDDARPCHTDPRWTAVTGGSRRSGAGPARCVRDTGVRIHRRVAETGADSCRCQVTRDEYRGKKR